MAILDNSTTSAPNTDVGLKFSKPGYNANTAADANQVFNSSWPSLTVAFTKQVAYSSGSQTIAHGLKITPFTMIWVIDTLQPVFNASYTAPNLGVSRYFPDVDGTNVYISSAYFNSSSSTIHIKCFNLDLTKDIDYPLLQTTNGFVGAYDPNFGIKLSKPNKPITSTDLRDFIIHSRCQTPLIMAVKTQGTMNPSNTTTIQYTNKLGYPSWNYGFIKQSTGKYHYAPFYSQIYPKTFTDGITTSLSWSGTDIGATIVVLRDPMFPVNEVDVSY